MAKRRTSGIQRRSRASDEALSRRIGTRKGPALDWRLLAIGGFLVLGAVVLVLLLVFGGDTDVAPCGGTPTHTHVGDTWLLHVGCGTFRQLCSSPSNNTKNASLSWSNVFAN